MPDSLTDKITNKFEHNIVNGIWNAGDYIPSTRILAEREGVSRGVITSAISILVGKGYLERIPRHGIKVCKKIENSETNKNVEIVRSTDLQLATTYAQKCMKIINERKVLNNNIITDEDVSMIMKFFGDIIKYKVIKDNDDYNDNFRELDKMLYNKGLRCAGWPPEKYTLYQCNLSRDTSDYVRGNLLKFVFEKNDITFDDRTMDYVEKRVHPNDSSKYLSLVNKDKFINDIDNGESMYYLEYREKREDTYKWVKLSINLSRDSNGDIIVFLLYLDINDDKKKELLQKELSEEDALTGTLNRRAFILQSEQLLSQSDEDIQHAFLMLDVDGFKMINDLFGHPVGDSVLSDLSKAIRSVLHQSDIFGRIGGDEFMICLGNVPYDSLIEKRANQIRELMKRNFGKDVLISGSIGISMFPKDGRNFDELYKKADIALYYAKEIGSNRVEFFNNGMIRTERGIGIADNNSNVNSKELFSEDINISMIEKKKILLVDDNDSNRLLISDILSEEYMILHAKDEKRALMTLRRYSSSISVTLISSGINGMGCFSILHSIQNEPMLSNVPVIIINGTSNDADETKAIEMGAMDFVSKPINKQILKLRVKNAVNKKENERARVQNSYCQLQGDEEQRYRFIIQATGIIVIEHDWVNSVFTYDKNISNYLAGEFNHRTLWRILLSDMVASSMTVKEMQNTIYELANDRKEVFATARVLLKTKDEEKHWFEMNVFKQIDELNITNKLIITLKDINEIVISEEKFRCLAEYDNLTKIYNRSSFLEKADELIKKHDAFTWELCVIDIDNFKVFNHLYGHDSGNHVLTFMATYMKKTLKGSGGLCGRIHADVFAYLQIADKGVVEDSLNQIKDALDKYSFGMKLNLSIGTYCIDEPDLPINTILDRAVIAHGIAKNSRENNIHFTDEMQKRILRDQEILSSMEQALLEKQFEVYLQPIYDYHNNEIITAEALIRWNSPTKGVVPPNDFIPLFEQNGFIFNLDSFVWDRSCELIKKWNDMGGKKIPLSVNVSRMDVYEQIFIPRLITILKKHNVLPELLRLEITESAYIDDSKKIIEVVSNLKKRGFTVEMDDFGSGFSSLNILADVPVDILKLDMRFILGKNSTGKKEKIMGHIINMAKDINMDIIAEGVETYEQAELLKNLGCSKMQGYYFSKPVKVEEFEKKLMIKSER